MMAKIIAPTLLEIPRVIKADLYGLDGVALDDPKIPLDVEYSQPKLTCNKDGERFLHMNLTITAHHAESPAQTPEQARAYAEEWRLFWELARILCSRMSSGDEIVLSLVWAGSEPLQNVV